MIDIRDPNVWTTIGTISMALATLVVILQGRRHGKDESQIQGENPTRPYVPQCRNDRSSHNRY
jgi:hypothetical protein